MNRNPGQFVTLSPETFEVIEKSLWAGQVSRGTFDITFQTLSGLWKFGDAQDTVPAPPSASEVARLRPRVDYRQIRVNADTRQVAIGARQQVGLGGIAKGYIVDKAAGVLTQAGIRSFLLRAGGDLYGAGTKPGGEPWIAGIQDPRGKHDDYFATLELDNHAFSTAGDYARAYVHQGKRYHHIIDPRTGYPASASKSVTIWAESALLADVIDDSVFILGPQQGLELVESVAGVGAVIVDTHDKVWVSKRLAGKVVMLHEPTPGD
jgi:thiamine biosynthesis lipoprotein